jgi:hypothetical protein
MSVLVMSARAGSTSRCVNPYDRRMRSPHLSRNLDKSRAPIPRHEFEAYLYVLVEYV